MIDRREAILARLVVVLQGIAEFRDVRRNNVIDDAKRPVAIVLDGDEGRVSGEDGKWRYPHAGALMNLQPQIYLRLAAEGDNVGAKLSTLRNAVITAVVNDAGAGGLVDLCHAGRGGSGRISYEGVATSFAVGRAINGDAHLAFSFVYPFKPSDLV